MTIVTSKYMQLIRDDDGAEICRIRPVLPGSELLEVLLPDDAGMTKTYYYRRDDLSSLAKFFQEFLS